MKSVSESPGSGKKNPIVTVGMPVFNGEQWLAESIESILAQTFGDFVLILSDNASTDRTCAICKHYARMDSRVLYLRNPRNIGVFKNYDRVFELSSSKYFKWASCNDICGERFLESCVRALENRPDVVLTYPRTALFDERVECAEMYDYGFDLEQELPSDRLKVLLSNLRLNNMFNGVIRSDVLRKTALNGIYAGSDINLIAELAMHGKFVEVPEILFYRRMNAMASSILVPHGERPEYFAHEPRDVLELRLWKVQIGLFETVWRAPLATVERLKIAAYLARGLLQNRKNLLQELVAVARTRMDLR